MNYRHAYHAGNFADLQKHAILLAVLEVLKASTPSLSVIDTHAGAGGYDLSGEMARRSGEAEAGIFRLLQEVEAPAVFAPLVAAVRAMNGGKDGPLYPGSPLLIAGALRREDRYTACELRDDDFELLRRSLAPYAFAQASKVDGYETAAVKAGRGGRAFILIDPPFERPDDYARIVEVTRQVLQRDPAAVLAIWTPLKDLETFDAFVRGLETVTNDALVAEVRLRPLLDPMKMNGSAMVLVGTPPELEPAVRTATEWIVGNLGQAGGAARVWRTAG
ncbi:23S rRNA (adenine(2030)-N(6))-methyltransferase RlmJ [Caulobacter sp. DWR1-3-2b1]|uniref:23S rRNA (adenine(2030)-N(6))-methyltransferase RlmJ n=1 Tax=Caulobacter sp. DWR1-3-2b1 TaxID=2804670 RepID=UPI003CF9F075